ncbi:hypothetical protein HanPI659440_Chr13g0519001 [Helianthus annuus]|nr:hypothetical protein HanPI659440_Chr13g0519001 [Helianthus annuus]
MNQTAKQRRRSYSDLFKKTAEMKSFCSRSLGVSGVESGNKVVVVPDRTAGFKELYGISVVARTVDLETLVDFDKLLRIAKVPYSRIQYLGGLFLLVSFIDEASATSFLDNKVVWGPWFSKVEVWKGQSLPLERVAWLRLIGIPLHLLDADVFSLIGDLFGKVLHYPKGLDGDHDLSFVRVGVLAGEAYRIKEAVSVSWRNRNFRVLVEEELDAWVPDCLGYSILQPRSSGSESSPMSSPVGNMSESEKVDDVGSGKSGEVESTPHYDLGNSHAEFIPLREEREGISEKENDKCNNEVLMSAEVGGSQVNSEKNFPFMSVPKQTGVTRKKPFNILRDKHKSKPKSVSPDVIRPNKRSRVSLDESFERFDFFNQANSNELKDGYEEGEIVGDGSNRSFDLNEPEAGSDGGEVRRDSSSNMNEVRGENHSVHPHSEPIVSEVNAVVDEDDGADLLNEINATVNLGDCDGR